MSRTPSKAKILIVESEDLFRRNIAERLRQNSYAVSETVEDGGTTSLIAAGKVDVVLLGIKGFMPRGLSLLRNIKQTYPTVQVILMIPSEEHSLSLSIEGMKLGAFNDLMIPFDVQTLVKHVDAAFAKKRQEENQSAADGHKGGAEIEDGTRADRRSKQGFGYR